jgi:hypothetical protein
MSDSSPLTQASSKTSNPISDGPVSHLRQEFDAWQNRFDAQPAVIQRYLEAQAGALADALTQRNRPAQMRFSLPDRVVIDTAGQPAAVPAEFREQIAGGLVDRLTRSDISVALRQRLAELEQSPSRAASSARSNGRPRSWICTALRPHKLIGARLDPSI